MDLFMATSWLALGVTSASILALTVLAMVGHVFWGWETDTRLCLGSIGITLMFITLTIACLTTAGTFATACMGILLVVSIMATIASGYYRFFERHQHERVASSPKPKALNLNMSHMGLHLSSK